MLILPRSCFFHVPKTGGTWAKRAIIEAGIPGREFTIDGDPHIGLKDCPEPHKFKFAFVRHPLSLYRSYWQCKMTYGWDPKNPMDMECKSDKFHVFVENILRKYPGIYTKFFFDVVGRGEERIEFIGKYENLPDDLITALKLAGEDFSEAKIRNLPPINVSDHQRFPAIFPRELEEEVKRVEKEIITTFYSS